MLRCVQSLNELGDPMVEGRCPHIDTASPGPVAGPLFGRNESCTFTTFWRLSGLTACFACEMAHFRDEAEGELSHSP